MEMVEIKDFIWTWENYFNDVSNGSKFPKTGYIQEDI